MQSETKVAIDHGTGSNGAPLVLLRFAGDLSSASKDAVLGTYSRLDESTRTARLVLDFSEVDYINSSGIALIIQLLIQTNKIGQSVSMIGLTPHFQKVFTMVGITKYAVIYPDEASAKALL